MRKIIIYILIAVAFLVGIFCINRVKTIVDVQDALPPAEEATDKVCIHDDTVFCTHLPLVLIDTGGQQIEKDNEIWAGISVIDNKKGNNHFDDTPDLTATAVIKYRGSSSYLTFDKKQYRIEFRKEYGDEKNEKYAVMGMSDASDWVLNGPFLDRTLIRNRLLFSVSRELLSWAPDTRYCEVFLDGEYQGLYIIIEPVTNEEGRLNLTDFGLISGNTAYVVKRERNNTEANMINTFGSVNRKTSYQLSISFPTSLRLTKFQHQYIENDIDEFERVLYSDQFNDPAYGYAGYIDVNAFVDYYIINELALNTDAGYLSTYVYKEIGGKIKMTVWDFNNAFNNYIWSVKSTDEFYLTESPWFDRLFQDRKFVDAVVVRFRELRKAELSEESLLNVVDENVEYLGEAINRNFGIWGYTFYEHLLSHDEQGNNRDPESYEDAIEQLKTCIVERGNFLDKNIEMLYQHCIN